MNAPSGSIMSMSIIAVALIATSPAWPQGVAPPCEGGAVVVQRGDTVSRLAERCGVSEGRLLAANPLVDGSDDLAVGMRLKLSRGPGLVDSAGRSLGSLLERGGDALSGLAQGFGSSVDDLLDKNPDLKQRLRSLGDRLNLPGVDAMAMKAEASPLAGPIGTAVTVTGVGLPKDAAVVVGAGAPRQAYEVLEQARTSPDGTLQATVRVPDWAQAGRLTFVIAGPGGEWAVRTRTFDVTPGAKL